MIAIVLIVGFILGFRFHSGPLDAQATLGIVLATDLRSYGCTPSSA